MEAEVDGTKVIQVKGNHARRLLKRFTVVDGRKFRLNEIDPGDAGGISVDQASELLTHGIERLRGLQEKLYAQRTWALLIILQGMDASGKDSTIKHVMSGVNPLGCRAFAFKAPSSEELAHDFLWRTNRCLPERGHIGIFNRSYYEEVLVVRVHQAILEAQRLPPKAKPPRIWRQRFEDIRAFERYLDRNGILVRKFFLYVSREKQRERFLERLKRAEKHWKFSPSDVLERACWDDYMEAYEDMIRHTATAESPWHVVPADHKWFTHLVVATAVAETLANLHLAFPAIDRKTKKELEAARVKLEREEK
jgi:PPK2 family polyphosphate:nucleotide phosphotransferase